MEKKHPDIIQLKELFETYFSENALWENKPDNISILVEIIDFFRPEKKDLDLQPSLKPITELLKHNETYREQFSAYVKNLLGDKRFVQLITDAGIYSNNSFFTEFISKFYNQILPEPGELDSVKFILSQLFYHKNDYKWIQNIPQEELIEIFTLISPPLLHESYDKKSLVFQVFLGLEILTLRICGKALEKEIKNLVPEFNEIDSPFLALYNEIEDLRLSITENGKLTDPEDLDYKQVFVILNQCKDYIDKASRNSSKYGISISVNKDLSRIRQQLQRIEECLPLLTYDDEKDSKENTLDLYLKIIAYHAKRKNLRTFLNDSGHLFAYEITSHTAKTGFKYISSDKKEYLKMLRDALGGGAIVGIMCITKLLLSKVETSDFGYAFLYSANYAIGFIILYLLGFTLATKQPAMTASTLVSYLEYGLKNDLKNKYRYRKFAGFFAQLIRTQFIAFLGNVLAALPIAMLGVWVIDSFVGKNVAYGKSEYLFHHLNPVTSLAILHAGIAGIYLYISGLIAGNVTNRNKLYKVDARMINLPLLKRTFKIEKVKKISNWYIHYWPGVISNLWFGIFMGTTASIGIFLGLNLDIRHITFGAGNMGLAIYGNDMYITNYQIIMSLLGIFMIGLMNFTVSFGLSLITAFKAKQIPFSELNPLTYSVLNYFWKQPLEFILPPSQIEDEKEEEEKE